MPHKDIEKRRACKKKWSQKHPEYFKQWHKDHPDFISNQLKKIQERRQSDPEVKERLNQNNRRWRRRNLPLMYGITLEIFNQIFNDQNGVCAICKKTEKPRKSDGYTKALSVDHKHDESKQVRGLLCSKCNTGLGMFEDSAELLLSAVVYLAKWTNVKSRN